MNIELRVLPQHAWVVYLLNQVQMALVSVGIELWTDIRWPVVGRALCLATKLLFNTKTFKFYRKFKVK